MAAFGSFETEREIYSDPLYTVYTARKSGEPKADYAVKVFSAQQVGIDTQITTEVEPLLSDLERARVESIRVQQQAAEASSCVAPVLESGHDERGVWYVTRYYPRSVSKIISGRVALRFADLHHILRSVTQGALDFKRACGRSHGDIKPSNIQISQSEKLTQAGVVLSDPLPGGADQAERYEIADLRAIGQILLQLVRQRAMDSQEDFLILPILPSPEWTRIFENNTGAWLELCNRLLDPGFTLDQLTLEQLAARLVELQPKQAVSPKLVMAIAAAVALLLVGAFLAYLFSRPGKQIVELTTDPPGASVRVDQKEQEGKTPLKLSLEKGSHLIEARHDALRLLEQTTNWITAAGGQAKLHFQFKYGSVAIKTDPGGATISRDGAVVGKTPADGTEFVIPVVAAGVEVKYELSLEERLPQVVQGVVSSGQRLALTASLPLKTESGLVELESTPGGARVLWQDRVLTERTPERVPLGKGTYRLTAIYRDWPPIQKEVVVQKERETKVEFLFPNAQVILESVPPGATAWVGTNQVGTTPVTVRRPAGPTTFRLDHPGFETTNFTVNIQDKKTETRRVALVTTNGVFELSSDPADAVILNAAGKEIGRTAAGKPVVITVAPDNHAFTARTEGLGDVTASLSVKRSEVKQHTFVFDYATVLLESAPPGAAISRDGQPRGSTPAKFVQKPGSKNAYRLTAPDYLPQTVEVTLQAGDRDRSVVAKLLPAPMPVTLVSEPPGATFFTGDAAVPVTNATHWVPWGPVVLTAKFPRLAEVSRSVEVLRGGSSRFEFKFRDYGQLYLTNLPPDLEVREGGQLIGNAANNHVWEPLGAHTYTLKDAYGSETIITNIVAGPNVLKSSRSDREWRNGLGLVLVRVRGLASTGADVWVGQTEVTEKQYRDLIGADPGTEKLGDDFPVRNVSWREAKFFCDGLSKRPDRPPGFPPNSRYTLPTLEQWKFLAAKDEPDKNSNIATGKLEPGRVRQANGFGLYDLRGNVREWLDDPAGANRIYTYESYAPMFGRPGAETFAKTEDRPDTQRDPKVGFRVILVLTP